MVRPHTGVDIISGIVHTLCPIRLQRALKAAVKLLIEIKNAQFYGRCGNGPCDWMLCAATLGNVVAPQWYGDDWMGHSHV